MTHVDGPHSSGPEHQVAAGDRGDVFVHAVLVVFLAALVAEGDEAVVVGGDLGVTELAQHVVDGQPLVDA